MAEVKQLAINPAAATTREIGLAANQLIRAKVPSGGSTGQTLVKVSDDSWDMEWGAASASGASYTNEDARDAIADALVAGTGIGIVVDDALDTITISNTGVLAVRDEGITATAGATSLDFVGGGVTATAIGSNVTVTIAGAAGIAAKDEGSTLSSAVTSFDFVGGGVVATNTGGAITVTVAGSAGITVKDEGSNLTTALTSLDFVGTGVTATNISGAVTVTIPGSASSTLTSAHLYVGDGSNVATDTAITGDVTITNGGVTAIGTAKVTNAMLADMAANTVKLRNAGSTGVPSNAAASDITTKTVPVAGDFVFGWQADGTLKKYDIATLPPYGTAASASGDLATEILADTPTGYWKCNDSGSTIADYSGTAYNLTVTGAPTMQASYLYPTSNDLFWHIAGFSTDGATLTSQLGQSFPSSTLDWTAGFIVKPETISSLTRVIGHGVNNSETQANNMQLLAYISTTGVPTAQWEHSTGTDDPVVPSPAGSYIASNGRVVMLHFIKDGTAKTVTFFVNGKKLGVAAGYTNNPDGGTGSLTLTLGYDLNAPAPCVFGHVFVKYGAKLSDARIWAHAKAAGLAGI